MFLAIGIDNARITFGVYRGRTLITTFEIASDRLKTADEYAYTIHGILRLHEVVPEAIHHCMISSVVAPLSPIIANAIEKLCEISPVFVGPGIKTGLNIKIDNPAQLGSDIVALTVGAIAKYRAPLILLDLGIVTTMSVVNAAGVFCGTIIMPGMHAALGALIDTAGSLPAISIEPPKALIGTNTVDSMRSGIVNGTCAMLDGLIDKILLDQHCEKTPSIVATGDLAAAIAPLCTHPITLDATLLMDGLCHLHHKNALHPKKGQ